MEFKEQLIANGFDESSILNESKADSSSVLQLLTPTAEHPVQIELKNILSSSVESTVKITAGPAVGTGFVIRSSKKIGSPMLVLTNNHVVRNEEVVKVLFSNGSEYLADVIGRSSEIDNALLINF